MIVLCFRCEILSYHITFSLVMCLAFCLEFTDFMEELTENRIRTLPVISHVATKKKTFVN